MKSNEIGELASALAKAQAKIRGALKDSDNPFFKSRYADLQSVWDVAREPLTSNDLSIAQVTASNDGKLELITLLMHKSGQWLEGRFPIVAVKNEPQAIGSATSYARRYALAAMVGIYQTDDDAEQAQARPSAQQSAVVARPVAIQSSIPALSVAMNTSNPETQQIIATVIDKSLTTGTGKGAPFDLILQKGPHAGKRIQDLSQQQALAYFNEISAELSAINRSPATLRGPSRDVFYALQEYTMAKKET